MDGNCILSQTGQEVRENGIYGCPQKTMKVFGSRRLIWVVVNSADDEVSPYIHVNGTTLFFASTGFPGFGRFDLYMSELERFSLVGTTSQSGIPTKYA
jgi:hypothetical protein